MSEILDIVDENDNVIGKGERSEIHEKGLFHRSCHIFLFNSKGELFLQRRSENKDRYPLFWDSSASGHVDAGESYKSCAKRELFEELGVCDVPVVPFAKYKARASTDNEHVYLFICRWDGEIKVNEEEIKEGRFFKIDEIKKEIKEKREKFSPSFLFLFEEYLKRTKKE